ncbi:uncharacterized protein BX663DRAFT_521408, partial [Cokeromyces recurvatus]|uniref:uncharacterized protein n=1 Tax=Cokeromyces recurvatus TaxID=90255 RepID=UPI00221E3CC9
MLNYLNRLYPYQAIKLLVKSSKTKQVNKSPIQTDYQAVESTLDKLDRSLLDFTVYRKESSIPNAGLGVFLATAQKIKRGTIVCFYPGTIYLPSEPILLASIANQYILKCIDGLYVDGKPKGLSRRMYQSIYKRENWPGTIQMSDQSWLSNDDKEFINPLAVGQYVNNGATSSTFKPNVCYQEVDLPLQFPNHLRRYIPNMYWNSQIDPFLKMRVIVLVTLRDIDDQEELFSTYMDSM